MAVNKATQDNLTAWKKKLLSKGGYTVPEYDDDEQLAKRNDYESVHRLMVNRGQVEEWGEREKRDVSSYAFSTKNAKGVKPFSAAQRVEAPVFNAGNLPDSFIGPRMQDSSSISRTEKNSPTKESGLLDFWGNSKFGSAALSAKGGSGTGLDAFGKADVTAVTGKQQAMYPDLGAKSQEEQEQEAREAAFSLLMDSQKPKTDALGQPVEQDSFRITDTLAPVAENKPASSEILTGEPMTPEQIAANKEQKENVPLRYRVGAAGRAAQNSVYNYADNLVSTLEGLHAGTDKGIDVYGEQHAALSDSFNNIAQRAQRDLEEGYISPITAQIIDTGTRMLIDTAITLAGGAAFGRASAAMSSNSVANQVLKTIQSPIFYTSLAQEFGSSYQEYIDNGVDKAEARVVSAGISALNAFIEAQGGTEEMISGTVSKILNKAPFGKGTEAVQEFVTNAMEEALEEMIQAPVSNLGAKATYDPERQVFNAEEMLGNAGTAFVSSLLLGGVATGTHVLTSKAVNSVSRAADNASIGKQVKETDGALDTLAKAAGRSEDTDVQQNLRKVYTQVSEGAEPSAQAVGELVRAMQQDQTVSYQQVLEDISRSSGKAADPGTQQNTGSFVQEYSRTLGENGSKAFHTIAEKVSAEELPQLKNAFQAYYNYGQWGKDFGNVDTSFRSFIDEAGAYAAYSAGRNDAEATVARAQARLQSAENGTQAKAGSKPGLAANLASRAVSAAERSYLDQIGRAFNVSIEMYTADTATEGNGYTAGGKIYLNTNSTNKLAGVVNHELTHIMQERSPKEYQQYRDLVAAYVDRQERGWFDSQVERMIDGYAKRGQQITREEAVDEVVADASERFLSDEEAINTLVKENRSVARKVLDALREIIRKLSELVHGEGFDTRAAEVLSRDMEVYREAEKLWVKALSESSEARTVGNEARYQLVEDAEGNKVVLIQKNIFEGHEGESRIKVVRDYLRQHIGEVYTIIESGQKVYLGKDLPDEYTRSKYTQYVSKDKKHAKFHAAQGIGQMIEIASDRRWEKARHAQKHASDAKYGFYKYTTRFAVEDNDIVYSADLVIRNADDGNKYLYDVINIKRNGSLSMAAAPQGSRQSLNTQSVRGISPAVSSTNIISESREKVKDFSESKKFQLSEDKSGQIRTAAFKNWFGDWQDDPENASKVVNQDGTPKIMFRGDNNDIEVFDRKKSKSGNLYGRGFYFTESESHANTYGSAKAYYLNIRNPLSTGQRTLTKAQIRSFLQSIADGDDEDYDLYNYGEYATVESILKSVWGNGKRSDFQMLQDINASAIGDMVYTVEWFNRVNDTDFDGFILPTETVVFDSRQIKSATDNNGDFSPINPNVRYQFSGDEFDWLDDGDMDENGAGYEWLDEQIDGAISGDDDGTITAQLAAVRAETKALEGVHLDEQQVNRVVKEVLRSYSSKYSAEKMAEVVNDALSAIRSRGNAGFAESVAAVYARAKAAVEASERLDKSLWDAEDVKSIRQTIRGTRMYVSEKERGDFKDGYNNYRRETFGTFKLTGDPADMSVDQVYSEFAREFPEYFDPEVYGTHDMLEAMREFIAAVRPTYVNEFEGNVEETALDMTAELLHQASIAAQAAVSREKSSEAVRADRSRQAKKYAENKKKLREKYTAKYKAGIQAEREKGAQRAASAKEQYQKKLTQQKGKYEARSERQKAGYEKREAEWKEQKQRLRDQSAGYRERIKTIREQNKQSRKAATDRRITTQIRHKIEKVVMNLGKELEHPTDTKHVPVELRGTVAAFLNTLDLSAQQEGLAASPFKETQRQAAWRKLRDTCEKIINEETGDSESWYIVVDPDIVSRIDDLLSSGAVYHLNELNREQAEELYKLVRAVDHMVRYTDKVRLEGQMVSATETARGIIEENQSRMKETRRILGALNKAEGFFKYDLLDPTRFSDMFGEHFHDLFHNLRAAENQKISRWAEVEEYFGKLADENGFKENELRKLEEDYKEFTVGNIRIRLSTAQVMSLYLTNKRQQGRSHLYAGGISLPDERKGTKVRENRRSYRVTEAEVEAIVGTLSDAQRKLADGMQAFASGQMSNWGNEASMYLYGYKKFTEKNYWPISSDSNYTRSEVSLQQTAAKNASLKNQGMTKALVEKASNPIQIDSAFDVFARHGTQMAAYSAYVGPLEDLNKVINWQTRHDGNWRSVRETLSGVGGAGALRYLNRFIDDVNGQAAGESSPYEGLMGAAKAASIAGNMRVVVQQPTAYWRAMAVIPPRHLLSGIAGHRVDTEEMHSVAPVTRWKEWGYFRDGASGSNLKELMVGKKGVKDRFVDKTMALAGKADDMTWKQLYRAVENWVSADGLERGTEEYRQEVGKRFTDVIDRTQVVDSVFQRTQAMRNNGFGWKMATAFMAEPLKSYNLLVGSFRQIGIAGDKKTAVKRAVMATVGFIASTLINAVVQSAWDVGRDKDPEETRADKFFQALLGDGVYAAIKDGESLGGDAYEVSLALLGGNLQDGLNPLNLIPVAKDVLSFYEGNDVQVMGLSAIADLMTAANNLAGAARGDSKKYTTEYYAVQLVRKLSAATGLPVGNIYREVESLINFTVTTFEEKTGVNASKLRFELDKLYLSPNGSRSVYYNLMYAARRDGNNELAAEVGNFLMASGVSRQTIENAMLSRIEKDAALSEVIVGYAEAYQAMDSEKMQALIDEAGKSGISGDELHRAAMRLIPSDEEEEAEAEEAFTADNLGDEAEMTDSYQVQALTNSLLSGDRANANAFNQSLLDAGKEQKEIDSRVQTQLKKRMLEAIGYESEKEMQEVGAKFDTQTEEYQYLHDHYGYTQYGYDDLVTAYLSGNGYDAIYRDMLGQHSSGENTYTAEGMEKELKSRIQQEFNAVYCGGTGSGWEQYRDALKKLGKSWDEILDSYKRSSAGKEWLRK